MSEIKHQAALRNLEAAARANAGRLASLGLWHCAQCGKAAPATVHQLRKTYCSKVCMAAGYAVRMRGEANPNYSNAGERFCERCGATYSSYDKGRRYCSFECYSKVENEAMRTNAKKDKNHKAMVDRLEAGGATVKDLSRAMYGVPDLLVWHMASWHLVEVKNPETSYGRRGLNKTQKTWAEEWRGGPVYILKTDADADKFLIGQFSDLESVGGVVSELVSERS